MLPRMLAPQRAHRRSGRPQRPRFRLAAAALTIGALFLIALQAASAGAPRTSGKADGVGRLYALEPQVFAAINDLRRAQGLAPLRLSRALSLAAGEHSLSMAEHGYFEHSSLDGSPFSRRVVAVYAPGARRWSVGENLVWASPGLSARQSSQPVARESSASGDSALAGVARRGTRRRPRGRGRRLRRPRRHDPDRGLRRPALARSDPSWCSTPAAFLPTQTPTLLAAKGLTANIPAAQEVRTRPPSVSPLAALRASARVSSYCPGI